MRPSARPKTDEIPDSTSVDPTWKNFACPKYIIRTCSKVSKLHKDNEDTEGTVKPDINDVLQKLAELISDPITSNGVPRICRLLHDYLHQVQNQGYKVKHLPAVMKVLEFLSWRASTINEYQIHLDRMLELCNLPPLLERTSESLLSSDIMEQYFTLLGYLLAILPTKRQVLKVHGALRSLLIRIKPTNVSSVKLEYCRNTMENSRLPITIAELLEASFPDMFPKILELAFLLTTISYTCCYKMFEAGILNTILIRMDLPYATESRCTRPPDIALEGDEYSEETTYFMMNTLWSLMKSILTPRKGLDNLLNKLAPAQCAMWGLRYALKRQILYSQHRVSGLKMRNEIAIIILVGLLRIPSWNVVKSGIADDVLLLLSEFESGAVHIWGEKVIVGRTNEDLFFEKILLLIIIHLADIDACHAWMIQRKVTETVLDLINPSVGGSKTTWSSSQFWNIFEYALHALSVLTPKFPEEFVKYNGTRRLLLIIEWSLDSKFDIDLVLNCVRTISLIAIKNDPILLGSFREDGTVISLIKLIHYIMELEKYSMQHQRVLTLSLMIVESLMTKQDFFQDVYGEESVKLITGLLFKCLYQKDDEFLIDQRLLLAVGSFIWKCIVPCAEVLRKFVDAGAIYIILDIMEISHYPARCLYLGVLTDTCDNIFCGQYLCTWRGGDKETGLMSLFATIWREEEIRLGVKRHHDGSVEDVELPLMGVKQWTDTYRTKLKGNVSPAINDMIGSVRSKIYSIQKIIERDSDRYEMAKERYKILLVDLPLEDRITIASMNLYLRLKMGEVWGEIGSYLEQNGITPLSMDGQVMFLMVHRHHSWAMLIKERQQKLTLSAKDAEEIKEKDDYAMLRDAKLAPSLDAFDELDYIRRTTDRSYMLRKREEQKRQVDSALCFPADTDAELCHRTFQDGVNVTAIYNQHCKIASDPVSQAFSQVEICPISPSGSRTSNLTYSLSNKSEMSSLQNYLITSEKSTGNS